MSAFPPIRSTGAFRLAAFLRAVAEGLFAVALPFQAIELGAGPEQLGVVGSLSSGSYAIGCLVFGRLIGWIPVRGGTLSSLLVLSALGMAIAYVPSLVLVYALVVLTGLATSLFWAPLMTWLAYHTGTTGMTREFGAFNLSWCAGFPIGLAMGGYMFEAAPQLPYLAVCALTAVAAVVLWWFTGSSRTWPYRRSELPGSTDGGWEVAGIEAASESPDVAARARRFLFMGWLSMFATYFVCGTFRYQLPKLTKSVGMAEGTFGALIFLIHAAQLLAFLLLMHTERWHFKRGLLWAAQVCVALSAFVVYLSVRPLALAAAFLLAGVGMGVTYFSSQYYGIRSPLRRARRAAIHEALIGSGYLAGAYCGGQAARAYSLRTPYAVSIFVLLALLMVQAVIDTCWRVSRKR